MRACRGGLCCLADELGYAGWMSSCRDDDGGDDHPGDVCRGYSPCLVLASSDAVEGGAINDENDTATYVAAVEAPPMPAQNLTVLCSQDSLATVIGPGVCRLACRARSCCSFA